MATWRPGNWFVSGGGVNRATNVMCRTEAGDVFPVLAEPGPATRHAEGNARLAAAAPDLFYALRAMVTQLEGLGVEGDDIPALPQARAAIAKVKVKEASCCRTGT